MTKHLIRKTRYSLNVIARIFGRGEFEKNCPCCGYRGRFETVGHPPRYGSLCPACGSLERHRLIVLADKQEEFFTGKEILHFAPEPIVSRIVNGRAKRYVSADLIPGRADCSLNIERIDQPDKSWDVVICCHVLEHVEDRMALAELHRILRHGAKLLVMVPMIEGWAETYENDGIISKQDRQRHFGQFDHVRYYGKDIRGRLKAAGFIVREHTAGGEDVVKYGLMRGEKIFECTRQ